MGRPKGALARLVGQLAFLLTACGAAHAAETATAPLIEEHCGAVIESSSPVVQAAVANLHSFQYVLHAVNSAAAGVPDPVFCTSAIALGRNAFGYVEYYVRIDLRGPGVSRARQRFRFVYQDASIQAYHNVVGQPWTAIAPGDAPAIFEKLVAEAKFQRHDGPDAALADSLTLARATPLYRANESELDATSVSLTEIHSADAARLNSPVYLVSWLTRPLLNPFLGVPRTLGVLISRDRAGATWLAELPTLSSDLRFPLEALRDAAAARLAGDRSRWSRALLEMASAGPH